MPPALTRSDSPLLAAIVAVAAWAAGIAAEEAVALGAGVLVGVSLLTLGRPPFADERVPAIATVVAWAAVALLAAAVTVAGQRWGFALLALAGAASATVLWRRLRAARARGLR